MFLIMLQMSKNFSNTEMYLKVVVIFYIPTKNKKGSQNWEPFRI
jgi:hypothetical protein